LIGTTEFDPSQRVRVKCVDGSVVETHGTVNVCMHEGEQTFQFKFHLVNKQVDLAYDGIIGRDFLRNTQPKICYESNTVVIKTPNGEWTKAIGDKKNVKENRRSSTLKVPKRSEVIVRIPVENGAEGADGLIEKTEITRCVYLASCLIRIEGDQTEHE
jgi:hypothetical protein